MYLVFHLWLVAAETKEAKPVEKEAPAKPKPPARAAKAPAKPLPELMEEDVIPSLKAILEAQDDLSNIELCFKDNKVPNHIFIKALDKFIIIFPFKSVRNMFNKFINQIFWCWISFWKWQLEGSFMKKGNNYSFWAFFPNGILTGMIL